MKTTNLAIMSVAILGIGLFGISSVSFNDVSEASLTSSSESTGMLGHVTAIHKDTDGNILSYSQTDNVVLTEGKEEAAGLLFGSANTTNTIELNERFNTIGLYNVTFGDPQAGDTFGTEWTNSEITAVGLRASAITQDNAAGNPDCASSEYGNIANVMYVGCTFTATTDSNVTYGAVLTNNGTSDTLFAARNFTSAITLNTDDQLTVLWDITIN
jgi:hypothetical protein